MDVPEGSHDAREPETPDPVAEAHDGDAPEPGAAAPSQGGSSARRTLAVAALSFLWPGLGHLALGRRRAAAAFAIPAVLLAILAISQIAPDPELFGANLWDPSYFYPFLVLLLGFAAWRVAALLHATLPSWRAPRRFRVETAVAALLVAAILAMHGAAAAEAWVWYQTSVDIQNNNFIDEAMATPTPSLTPTPEPTATPTSTLTASPSATATPTPTPVPSPTQYVNPDRITFLLIGIDFTTGRSTGSTDTLMVISVDTKAKTAAMISVPRDTAGFELYWGGFLASNVKINSLLAGVYNGKIKSPDDPMTTLKKEIGYLVGIPIDYYAAIDMDGFPPIVDAIGGVDVYNPRYINDSVAHLVMPAGPVHLDGKTALKYVRSRENGGSDYLRASRQQQVLLALKAKILSGSSLSRFNAVLSIVGKVVATDFPLKNAKNYVSVGKSLTKIDSCVLGPPYSYHPDTSTTRGIWVSHLDYGKVASLSLYEFGKDSTYSGFQNVTPKACQS